jgi:hypothetical protein
MSTTIRLPRNTLKEILDSLDELAQFSEGSPVDLNILSENGQVSIYIRHPSEVMVHELTSGSDIDISAEGSDRICLSPSTLSEVINKADSGTIEIEFQEHDYVVRYEDAGSFSEPLTLRLRRFEESEFESLPEFGEMKSLGTLDRPTLYKTLDIMSSVSTVVKIGVQNHLLSVDVEDKVAGEGTAKTQLTDSEVNNVEAWYSIEPIKQFLRRVTSNDEVELYVNEGRTLLMEISSPNKVSRLYIAERVDGDR